MKVADALLACLGGTLTRRVASTTISGTIQTLFFSDDVTTVYLKGRRGPLKFRNTIDTVEANGDGSFTITVPYAGIATITPREAGS